MESNTYSHIPGWGIDADPTNDPTHPIRHRIEHTPETPDNDSQYSWQRPTQQPVDIEVLRSIERPTVSAVFGTSMPPAGLSGQIRRLAFKSSESAYSHWLPLLLADRINVVEGILHDFSQGRIPNIFAEKGLGAAWRYDRPRLVKNVLIGVAVTTVLVALLNRKAKKATR